MSEQFPEPMLNDMKEDDGEPSLPADLQSLYRRLSADGVAWRASVPTPPTLDEQIRRLAQSRAPDAQSSRALSTVHSPLKGYTSSMMNKIHHEQAIPTALDTDAPDTLRPSNVATQPTKSHTGRRFRTFAAIAAMLVIVALIVSVFQVFGHILERGKPSPATHKTASWEAVPQLSNTVYQSTIAPSNPHVVYQVPGNGRSDNDGATWHAINVPSFPDQGGPSGLFVSPLDAHTIIVQTSYFPNTGSLDCPAGFAVPMGDSAFQWSMCEPQYISTDGGATLHLLHTPISNILSGSARVGSSSGSGGLLAQGHRLYAMVGVDSLRANVRLIVSDDGGLNWSLADGSLYQQVSCVYDYLPAPTGSVIFADVGNSSDCSSASTYTLWRSDDAGATWTHSGDFFPKDHPLLTLLITAGATPAQPVLYAYAPKATVTGYDKMGDPMYTYSSEPHDFYVSADGGKTWMQSPDRGAPTGQVVGGYYLLCVLSDGTLVSTFVPKGNDGSGNYPTVFYGWKLGQASWTPIAPALQGGITNLTATENASGGDTLWVEAGAGNAVNTLRIRLSL